MVFFDSSAIIEGETLFLFANRNESPHPFSQKRTLMASDEITVNTKTEYQSNCDQLLTPDVIQQHRGRWLAISQDGTRIVASCPTTDTLQQCVEDAGESLGTVHLKWIPADDVDAPAGSVEIEV